MSTVSVTVSMRMEELAEIHDYAKIHNTSRSRAMAYLVKMGFVYLRILAEQENDLETEGSD